MRTGSTTAAFMEAALMEAALAKEDLTESGFGADLFLLPVGESFLVYSPSRRLTALMNAPAAKELRLALKSPSRPFPKGLEGFLEEAAEGNPEGNAIGPPPDFRPLKPLFLGLLPTRGCNCRCLYCDFGAGGGNGRDLAPPMAARALGWYADFLREARLERMEVHLFGGEPFIRRQTVEVIVHRSRLLADKYGFDLHLEASTNGLFEPDYARFVGDYFQAVVLSLDGFENSHDGHRPVDPGLGSFAFAERTARVLSGSQTRLCLRCCVSKLNIDRLEEIADWFCRRFQPAVINFEPLTVNPKTVSAGLEPPGPYEFARLFCRARARAARYGIGAVYAAVEGEPWRTTFCPLGRDALIVNPDGRVSGCYLPRESWLAVGLDLDVGFLSKTVRLTLDPAAVVRLRRLSRDKPRCRKCFCRPVCSGGCHVHHSHPASPADYDDFCRQTRLIAAVGFLEEMGLLEVARAFLADGRAMESLADQKSDLLEDV